ncbi:hypothetical protein [Rhizobium leguminosarum]|uniref:hypothetical protein n=1 Tax=Rhizobium leguminosarum TaxID=384 RepID=UPI001C97D0FA|nr:hypothetical protein [Rhizobium leguminosarum]MBY5700920.1 hypothetical protein [Rhizobium leguminosarum]
MKKYLIDVETVSTFWVDANSEAEALAALKDVAAELELRIEVGDETPIEYVDVTWRVDEALMVDEYDH